MKEVVWSRVTVSDKEKPTPQRPVGAPPFPEKKRGRKKKRKV
jgi:hypothetical protein